MKVFGADIGKVNTKLVTMMSGVEKKIILKTKVDEYSGEGLLEKDTHIVRFRDKEYIVGEGANISNFDVSKNNEHHIISLLTALALNVDNRDGIGVCAGMPISLFFNRDERESFKSSLLIQEPVIVDDVLRYINIDKVMILPETIGIIYKNPQYYKDKLVAVIDIGGLNTNGAIYRNGKPIRNTAFTINEGGNILENKVKKELNIRLGLNYQDYEIPYLMKDGVKVKGKDNKEGNQIVKDIKEKHIESIVQEMKKNNWNVDSIDIMFTGGGSLLLNEDIMRRLENAIISSSALWDNARAFYLGGKYLWEK